MNGLHILRVVYTYIRTYHRLFLVFFFFGLIVLVGDPHAEVPDVEDSTPSPADVPHDPQDVASLCPRHHGMVDQRHVLPLHTTPPDIITPPSTV